MSSLPVRTLVRQFLADNSTETVVDFTAQYDDLRSLLKEFNVGPDAPWLGLDFIGDEELPISLTANNEQGLYREYGAISLHICAVARIGVGSSIESRAEILRNLFRGRRIGRIVVEAVSPVNTGPGSTLEFEAGYVSGTVNVDYYYDMSPT